MGVLNERRAMASAALSLNVTLAVAGSSCDGSVHGVPDGRRPLGSAWWST